MLPIDAACREEVLFGGFIDDRTPVGSKAKITIAIRARFDTIRERFDNVGGQYSLEVWLVMAGSDQTDQSTDCPRIVRGLVRFPVHICRTGPNGLSADQRTGPTVLNMFKNFCRSADGPRPVR